jgi:hypothetical protein
MNSNFFTIGKSAVNFCESDIYYYLIGEPWNVISSLAIVLFGLYGLYKINYINNHINLVKKTEQTILYFLLSMIGVASIYFHILLSPFAHWVDIIFISMILVYSLYCLEANYKLKIIKFVLLFIFHFISSLFIPQIHIFLQIYTGFIIKNKIEFKLSKNILINHIDLIKKYYYIKMYFILSLIFWFIDYFGCFIITPYHVHWIFHILIGLVSYSAIDLIKNF